MGRLPPDGSHPVIARNPRHLQTVHICSCLALLRNNGCGHLRHSCILPIVYNIYIPIFVIRQLTLQVPISNGFCDVIFRLSQIFRPSMQIMISFGLDSINRIFYSYSSLRVLLMLLSLSTIIAAGLLSTPRPAYTQNRWRCELLLDVSNPGAGASILTQNFAAVRSDANPQARLRIASLPSLRRALRRVPKCHGIGTAESSQ